MKNILDFAANDQSKNYCVHCARPDGEMQSFEEKKENLTKFIVRTQGLDERALKNLLMRKLPAWQKYFD